ncbi:uncharacterized protein [Miscanthus floridulus]|uniref:uncharacterized protein n=1 Tax=Miscanthus floridulus TaxID=154761 RepID=UPI00345796A9
MTDSLEMGDSSGAAVAAQPRQEVVVRMVPEVGGTSWPTLTRTNYGEWAVTMKIKLRAQRLWNTIDKGTANKEDMLALEAIIAVVPAEYREPLGAKNSAKKTWEVIAAMRVSSDRAKKATAQLLKQEYATLKFKDDESVEDFSLCMQSLISKLRNHGITINEDEAVSKYIHSVPVKYIQIALSIETILDLSTLTIEDVTGRLWEMDEHMEQTTATMDSDKLLLIEEEWAARMKKFGEASSSHGGDGKCRVKTSLEKKKKKVDPNACRRCEKTGHWAKKCPNRKQEKKAEAHLRRLSFPKAAKYHAADALELIHGDLYGPIMPATNDGQWYFLLLVDDCSRYMWLQLLPSKDKATEAIKKFKARTEAESGKNLCVLWTDRGGEFTSVEFATYCVGQGVVRHHTAPYSPHQNGMVELRN